MACRNHFPFLPFAVLLATTFLMSIAYAEDYTPNVEIVDATIGKNHRDTVVVADLYLVLKNKGERVVTNAVLAIVYYDKDDEVLLKTTVKNALGKKRIAPGQTQKYRIRLKGDIVNIDYEQYPYDRMDELDHYEVTVRTVSTTAK